MEIYALDKDFNLITTGIRYMSLQWIRRYYECGEFFLQIPADVYDSQWAYIGTSERPEIGIIEKEDYTEELGQYVMLSGFFCEKLLDDKACYPRFIGRGITETLCRQILGTYIDDVDIEISEPNDPPLGDYTESDFSDNLLGTKLYSILETRELSQRVEYDYEENKLVWSVWQGFDRTQSQEDNPWYTFSTEFDNVRTVDVTDDRSAVKNYAIIPCNADSDGKEQNVYYLDMSDGGYKRQIVFNMRSKKRSEDQSLAEFKAAILQEAREKIKAYNEIQDINVDAVQKDYMVRFDLGDKVDVIIDNMQLALETRIVEVAETFDSSAHTVTVGFGNKRMGNYAKVSLMR